jgi:hypothetical protein
MYPGLSSKQSSAMLKDVATDNYKNVSKYMADYVSMFGLIMSCLSKEGGDMVKENGNWDAVNVAKDPLTLIQIIKNVYSLNLQHIDIDEARYVAMQRYQSIRHLPGVYLTDYRHRKLQHLVILRNNVKRVDRPRTKIKLPNRHTLMSVVEAALRIYMAFPSMFLWI